MFLDTYGKWQNEISIVISDYSVFDGIWIEEEYIISQNDPLYEQFKTYFTFVSATVLLFIPTPPKFRILHRFYCVFQPEFFCWFRKVRK